MLDLVLAIHCHQPVGNFEAVFEKAVQDCYRPLLDLLAAHPAIRVGLHFSGPLLEWLEAHQPQRVDLLAELVGRGQVEPLSGGFFEPLLAAIPLADARGQVGMMNDYLQSRLGRRPTGFWLSERIWDPALPLTLAGTGMEYTLVDDTHFYYAGLNPDDLYAPYVTEKEGQTLTLLATPLPMRYLIPFKPVPEVMAHLRSLFEAGRPVAVYGDDGEKFGLWPGTHEWVIEKGWLNDFFTAVAQNADWLRTTPPGEYLTSARPAGRLYLPQASYEELTEWALPPARGQALEDMIATLKAEGRWEDWRPFVRGGTWDNFLVKYEESNRMHKKMLFLSERVGQDQEARELVWRAQCNCAYWHGLFGGLYLGHLRRAVFENLLCAQARLEKGRGPSLLRLDLDKDKAEEVLLSSATLTLGLDPEKGGSLFEVSHLGRALNLADTLTRRPEAYHRRLQDQTPDQDAGEGVKSIHELVRVKEEGLAELLVYDPDTRASLRDHFLENIPEAADLASLRFSEEGDFVQGPYQVKETSVTSEQAAVTLARTGRLGPGVLTLSKTVRLTGAPRVSLEYSFENPGPEEISTVYAPEFNLTLYSDQDPQRYLLAPESGRRWTAAELGGLDGLRRFDLVNAPDGLRAAFTFSQPVSVRFYPVRTVSMSEEGLEQTYQGTCLFFFVPLTLKPKEKARLSFEVDLGEI